MAKLIERFLQFRSFFPWTFYFSVFDVCVTYSFYHILIWNWRVEIFDDLFTTLLRITNINVLKTFVSFA